MLGASHAVLLGACAAPPEVPALISLWSFDETGGMSFADSGPANVPMTIVGAWADLSTASMVQGIGGTSAYTNGTGHATIPANDPDHNLSELTISFYYQRNSAAAKHILLAAGNGTQAGDFSIEVLADGRLRGYHVGQAGVLRFFESSSGITGTDLQVGTAHRIDLTLGSLGARIYLDGAPLIHAFILANTNGWNNTRIKYLGVFTDGVGSPADGAFDRLRLWDRQLTSLQIAILEPAQSITLPGAPQPPQQLPVPSLAEWLVSDESDPTPTKFVSNQNRGNGSGSSPANAQEVQAALNGASPGQTFLVVCQTPGTIEHWNYPNGLTFPSGSSGNYITLQARQGDGVVISAGQDFAGARTPNSGFWTQSGLSQADIDKRIWKSTATFPGGTQTMMGFWVEFGHVHQLLPAGSMTNLHAPYGTADSPTNYATPMVHKDTDGTVYIRMQKPHPGKYSVGNKWQTSLWPGHPTAVSGGQLNYPVTENPNDYVIHLFHRNASTTTYAFNLAAGNSGGFIAIGSGINSMGFRRWIRGGHDIRVRRGTHLVWHLAIVGNGTTTTFNWDVQRARISDGSKRHASRAEWKFGGWLEGVRSVFMTPLRDMKDMYFKNCTISDFHELGVAGGTPSNNAPQCRFRNCTIFNLLDEGIQGHSTMSRVELGYCFLLNAGTFGPGTNTPEGNDPNPGQWFMHHCIVDVRCQKCVDWRDGVGPNFIFSSHSPDGNQPHKHYNNTIFYGPDQEEERGNGLYHLSDQSNTITGTAACHEVFNNIIIRHDVQRYDMSYSFGLLEQRDCVSERMHVNPNSSNEIWDYNLYYKDVPNPADGLLRQIAETNRNDGANEGFATLAAFRASAKFNLSKTGGSKRGAYSPGFEGNGTDTKPTLPSLDNFPTDRFKYRPSATSAVTTATSASLSGANWWSTPPSWGAAYFPWNDGDKTLAPSGWKGALDPNGSTMLVGVQNP
jgi:hypothetical protein